MNKFFAALVAGLLSVGAFAQTATPVAPATQATTAVAPAPAKELKKKKAAHKAKKAGHKAKKATAK